MGETSTVRTFLYLVMSKNNNKGTNQNTLSSDCFEFQLFTGEDFNALINSSENTSAHFQFKSEKLWTTPCEPVDNRFLLDINFLAQNLSTLPFSKRFIQYHDSEQEQNFSRSHQTDSSENSIILRWKKKIDHWRSFSNEKRYVNNNSVSTAEFKKPKNSIRYLKERHDQVIAVHNNISENVKKSCYSESKICDLDTTSYVAKSKLETFPDKTDSSTIIQNKTENSSVEYKTTNPQVSMKNSGVSSTRDLSVKKNNETQELENWLDSILDE